jgi:DNA (cytosine-5)-methyltransferase 1
MVDQLNMNNISIFDCMYEDFKIDKPIRLIELFAGVGSQAMALRNLGADFEHYKISEWEVSATASYKAIHMENDNTDYSLEIKKNELPQILFNYGISIDGKEPMTLEQIERKGEKWQRITYNNLRATNNLGSICNFKGEDLEIVDTDSFTYLLTYSFPCQDLSVAGKMQGMTKDSGTRSGLLWEVERLLNEVEELPQVLLMENVPQVIGKKNIDNFHLWQQFLEDKGYSNFVDTLNAKNYGVAQNRNRTFMVSILGKWNYNFPKQIPLTKTMKDYLEDEVDEKYYINNEKAQNSLTI